MAILLLLAFSVWFFRGELGVCVARRVSRKTGPWALGFYVCELVWAFLHRGIFRVRSAESRDHYG